MDKTYYERVIKCFACNKYIAFENENAYRAFTHHAHLRCLHCNRLARDFEFTMECVNNVDKNLCAYVHDETEKKIEIDNVNHPKHYTNHPSGVECITITRHMLFNVGNAIKYLWRADEKGNDIQDLEKAMWYIKDEIQRRNDLKNGMYAQKKNNAHE